MTHPEEPEGLNLAERIRRLAAGRTTLDVAQFQFIGLKDIRACYGEKWPAKRDRVTAIARHFIGKRIEADDLMIPGADGFLVVFGHRTGLVADAAAQRISKALNDFFIGSDADDIDVRFEARRKTMSVEDLASAFADLIIADSAPEEAVDPTLPHGELPPAMMRIAWQPMWDVKREALTTWVLNPIDPRTGSRVSGYQFEADPDAPRHFTELDELQLRASEEAIRKLFGSGRKAICTVSLHVSSLQNTASLTRLFSVMAGFDKELIRYRIIRIAGIEPGFPRIYLEDICRALKLRIPHLVFGLHWSEPDVASILRLQPAGVGFPLPPEAASHARPEVFARIRGAIEAAHQHHVQTFVSGGFGPELAQHFAADGADILGSPKIWPTASEPCGVQTWPAANLGRAPSHDAA